MISPVLPLAVQWHITSECGNNCLHCYMSDPGTASPDHTAPLDLESNRRIIGRFLEFESEWPARIELVGISGGDPFLYPHWKELVLELRSHDKRVVMMGNPETLTEENVSFLKAAGVTAFQMSLDGREAVHDTFRSPGSFRRTVDKLDLLARHGVFPQVMFTLYPENREELIPLVRFVAHETSAGSFCFDLGCHVGNAASFGDVLTPEHVRSLFAAYLEEKEYLAREGNGLYLDEKPNLLKLSRFEKGDFYPASTPDAPVIAGCLAGWMGLALLSDGTALACRRLPIPAGNLVRQSFGDIFLGSELMRKLRRRQSFRGCRGCDFYQHCRGCPSYVYGITGDPFAENPLCFRDSIPRTTDEAERITGEATDSGDYREEFSRVAARFSHTRRSWNDTYFRDSVIGNLVVRLASDPEDRHLFLRNPRAWLEHAEISVEDAGIVFLMQVFSQKFGSEKQRENLLRELSRIQTMRMLNTLFT